MYDNMNDAERREFIEQLIEKVELYDERQSNGQWLKAIEFKLLIIEHDMKLSLDNGNSVETVVQLVRKKPDTYIDITVDMDELDLTSSEAKATYDEIKDYIFDKHRVKVSSLYIAQIKQKHGIIERDCYNNSKKDNPKQPQCPPEKAKLIEEALRHFKMIP